MAEPKPITAPATAESEGDHLFVWLDDHHHHHPHEGGHHHHPHERLAFVGTYTTPKAGKYERQLEAKGTLTFESKDKFVPGEHGKFKVKKKKDGAEYDVEVVITYHKEGGPIITEAHAVVSSASYEIELYVLLITLRKGDLREGEGVGEWKWIKHDEKK
ncbi:hypothetical protein K443DRAFT_112960 [Laccaria amethystina LaAM-08-1]|uniref:Uncharacterized protein n=1 Tax=Laccaria amethystina LaAM-08-1 TaxID=1095629 RepID=A0A0C9WPI1_9AGAR|nr:hypothetical protein K443DRAFT_112960 [Laccaria amethystina LaAM-08-1]